MWSIVEVSCMACIHASRVSRLAGRSVGVSLRSVQITTTSLTSLVACARLEGLSVASVAWWCSVRDGWGERPSGVDGTRAAFSIDGSGEFILCAADFVTTHVARDRNGLQ